MATPNYVTLVNRAIEEAGVDLASYASDGSDFNSTLVDKMMPKFKNWVARAWRDIQQESMDWEFMSSTAEINLDPGITFYNNNSNNATLFEEMPPGVALSLYDNKDSDSIAYGGSFDPDYTLYVKDMRLIGQTSPNGKYWGTCLLYKRPDYMWSDSDTAVYEYPLDTDVSSLSLKPNTFIGFFEQYAKFQVTGTIANNFIVLDNVGADFTDDPSNSTPVPRILDYIFFLDPITGIEHYSIPGGKLTRLEITSGETDTILFEFTCVVDSDIYNLFQANLGTSQTVEYRLAINGASYINCYESDIARVNTSAFSAPPIMVHSWASYNFEEEVEANDFVGDISEIDNLSFRMAELQGTAPASERKLEFVPWESFKNKYDFENTAAASWPRLVTEDNTGRWRFYPPLNQRVGISFDYQRDPQTLSAYSDTPTGLDENYADLIMWKAIMYYGEYDEQPAMFARAYKNYRNLLVRFEMQYREKFHFKPKRLY